MNLDLDFSAVPRFLRGILGDLRQKRLWPVAAILLVAIIAIPVLLAKSSHPVPVAQASVPTPPPAASTTLPALSVQSTLAHSRLTGKAHDPFAGASSTTSVTTTASSAAATTVSTATAPLSSGGSATAVGGTGTSSSSAGGTPSTTSSSTGSEYSNPPSITPNAKPKPAPSGLTSTQAYDVSLAITNSAGGLNTVDPLKRLTVLPNNQQPLLVELGVLKGGKRVLFAVQPGTVVNGPGTCTPGPLDCEILSLRPNQTESLSTQSGQGVSQISLFAVTGLSATHYSSGAAANRARRSKSSAGQALLKKSNLPALSLFQYQPSLGYVVDLRNVTVGR